ncbi:hypothetical protein [Bremerella cremea]|uniref:cupredoxin domain-containing protein n=1 Tax=Bremerella cremea TaxID=1031537 RepID=UPI0031E65218
MKTARFSLLVMLVLSGFAQGLMAEEWGDVQGRFIVQGKPVPAPGLAIPAALAGFCGGAAIANPALRIGNKGELQDVALWLYVGRNEEAPKPHPMYEKLRANKVVIRNAGCLYDPIMSLVRPGQKIEFVNADPIPHNFKVEGFQNAGINFLLAAGKSQVETFADEERYPMSAGCNIHPWMDAFIVIRESPYMAVSGEDGKFKIEKLPVGKHTFQVWHGNPGSLKQMKIGGEVVKDKKGLIEIDVKPGLNDLGDIEVDFALLQK